MTASPIVTIAGVLAFARSKPAGERYRYSDTCGCAVAQFVRETIDPNGRAYPGWWTDSVGGDHDFARGIDVAAMGLPHTFGAFADRLEGIGNE